MELDRLKMMEYILDSIPYRIVFVDTDFIIRYMNKTAEYHYYGIRGYRNLIGKSLFDCHNDMSKEILKAQIEKLKNHGNEILIGVTPSTNERYYINPVRDENGELVGFFERFEQNMEIPVGPFGAHKPQQK